VVQVKMFWWQNGPLPEEAINSWLRENQISSQDIVKIQEKFDSILIISIWYIKKEDNNHNRPAENRLLTQV
jgi:hypothetical protein